MEKEPDFERQITDEELITRLGAGIESPGVRELLIEWTKQQEALVGPRPEDSIRFNMRRGAVYAAAGYIDEAIENYEDARLQALNENLDALILEIDAALNKLRP